MKKFFAYLIFFILIATLPLFFFQKKNELASFVEKEKFDPSLCQQGYAGSWSGACICFENYEGRYCDKKTYYISASYPPPKHSQKQYLKKKYIYKPVTINKKVFVLSTELFSHSKAVSFCSQLGKNFRLATRKDFNCSKTGLGCLDNKLFYPIKKEYGHRGFFWLEEITGTEKAYYVDLNDATIYHTDKNNATTAQSLCIFER